MLNTLATVARDVPPNLASAAQGIGKRAWEKEFLRRLQARAWTVLHLPRLGTHLHTREGDSSRSGHITAFCIPPESQSGVIALQIERTQVTAKTRHKLSTLLQRGVAQVAVVIVLYQPNPKAAAPPTLTCPEGHVISLNIPFPTDWPDELLTHNRIQSRIRLGPSYRGARGEGGARLFPLPFRRAKV